MASLILLPSYPDSYGGYGKAVRADIQRLDISRDDLVVVYAPKSQDILPSSEYLHRSSRQSWRRLPNIIRMRCTSELQAFELRPLVWGRGFSKVFCGDTIFYHAARAIFPDTPFDVRFHNYFSMARYRQSMRRYPISLLFRYNLYVVSHLEREILNDPLVAPIFITPEEQNYARLAFPHLKSECWPIHSIDAQQCPLPKAPSAWRLVFMGSLAHHTRVGVDYLMQHVLPRIRERSPGLKLHLFGGGTERLNRPASSIFGHGYFQGDGYPFDGDGLFVVPDLVGGGIKVKVGDMLRAGVPFISTPFGVEGYELPKSPHVIVVDIDEWPEVLESYFRGLHQGR